MPEILQFSNNETLFILPRGGSADFSRSVKRLESADLPLLDACAARWPYENSEIVALIHQHLQERPRSMNWLACETAFFSTLPEAASAYALPLQKRSQGLRRLGAEGLFHSWAARQFPEAKRLVSVHLSANTTLAAIQNGKAVDSSVGYSLLEGLPGLTTCGDIDPSLILLLNENGYSADEIEKMLYTRSGWQSLCNEPLTLLKLLTGQEKEVILARSMYLHTLVKGIGAMLASLGGADLIFLGADAPEDCENLADQLQSHLASTGLRFKLAQVQRETILRDTMALHSVS